MKIQIAIVTACTALLHLGALPAEAIPTFAESFGLDGNGPDSQGFYGTGDDYPLAIAAMPDGGVVVVGKLSSPTNSAANDALVRFAADGTILWKYTLSGTAGLCYPADVACFSDSGYRVARIVSDSEGGIYLASFFSGRIGGGGPSYGYVAKFNPSGGVVWQKNIGRDGDNTSLNSLSLTPTGKLVITSSAYPPNNTGHTYPVLSVLDSATGVAQFIRGYDNTSVQYLRAQAGTGSKDGTKYIFCTEVNDLTVVLVNAAGDVLDTKNYFNGYKRPGATMSIPTSDGDFMILAGNVVRKVGADQVTVNGVTSTVLATRFERVLNYEGMSGHTIVQTADGGYLIGGSINAYSDVPPNTSGAKAGIYRLNAQGDITRVYAYGGFNNETAYDGNTSAGLCSAVPTTDGGFAFTTDTLSYRSQTDERKPDWWIVKTDALGKLRNFKGVAVDVTGRGSSTPFVDSGSQPQLGTYTPIARSWDQVSPQLVLTDPAGSLRIQASSPRILGSGTAQAVVGQHFSYNINGLTLEEQALRCFLSGTITYSADGLPQGCALDPKTGIISYVPPIGSETAPEKPSVPPITITLHATDGTETANPKLLTLTIGDGVPSFSVNESDQPVYPPSPGLNARVTGLTDTILRFSAKQPGALAGRLMTVQATTTPENAGSWQNLSNGLDGRMLSGPRGGQYVLNSTNYPTLNNVFFRAKLRADGHDDLASNVVGPFDLLSSKPRAPQTVFHMQQNDLISDFDFYATLKSTAAGVALRVQSSTTPADEASWTDLHDGGADLSHMTQIGDASHYVLRFNKYPPADAIYFRSVTTVTGGTPTADTLSSYAGPYDIKSDTPPVVTISVSPSQGGSGTKTDPFVMKLNGTGPLTFTISASATTNRLLKSLSIYYDGRKLTEFAGGVASGSIPYTTNVTNHKGAHVIQAVAVDDLRVVARANDAIYVLIAPAGGSAAKASTAPGDGSTATAADIGNTYKLVADGVWSDLSIWSDLNGKPGVPGATDLAIVDNNFTVRLKTVTAVGSVELRSGRIIYVESPGLLGSLYITQHMSIYGGAIESIDLTTGQDATCLMLNDNDFPLSGEIHNDGTFLMKGTGGITGLSNFVSNGITNFAWPPIRPVQSPDLTQLQKSPLIQSNSVTLGGGLITSNLARVVSNDSAGVVSNDSAGVVSNDGNSFVAPVNGSLITNDGGTLITNDGGTLITNDGGTLISQDGGTLISQDGGTLISQDGGTLLSDNGSGVTGKTTAGFKTGNAPATTSSNVHAATAPSGFTQNGGRIDLNSLTIIGPVTVNGGVMSGTGLIKGNLNLNGGFLSPGNSTGTVVVTGNYTQGSNGTLIIEAAGGQAGQSDRLRIGGSATLGGKLDVRTIKGYVPLANDPFVPIAYGSVSGSFSNVSGNVSLKLTSTGPLVTIDAAKPNPGTGQPLNIATRMSVQTGDNVLIAGFIVTGPSGSTKKVLIRGLGPSLAQFGVSGTLSDPFLELHKPDGSTVVNDNWQQGDTSQIPSGFGPNDPREAVIVATLSPGSYSAIVKGAHGETGIGIAELYDLDSASPAKLANISTRGFINTGDNVMIGGFIIGGAEPAKILVRAIGPTLTDFGVQGALADPTLELHDANGSTISNDDWRESQEADIIATTIPPNKDREPAILATLVPGNYTAVVRGKNNTTGVGLVEAYNLQ